MTLSPCKHCGAVAHYAKSVTDPHLCWSVSCSNLDCGMTTRAFSQQQHAVDAWQHSVGPAPIYSHRNGETEAPTIYGAYWFSGVCNTYAQLQIAFMVDFAGDLIYIGDGPYKLNAFVGQWWGPIAPPW